MARALLLPAAFLVSLCSAAAAKTGCAAVAKYPDGSEITRECIVEGEGKAKGARGSVNGIDEEFLWLKDTRWNWNNWRDVIFKANGAFLAPAEGCEREGNPQCKWATDSDKLYVYFGGAGRHTLTVAPDQQSMYGARDSDGDEVSAARR
ncbi:hypothetical protein AB1Y20_001624 [Prymnesium parvum]|uniref:Uncharacterized protein n=1 Tax=Prymnesium parvum TaxID=97485 RepID=A0AB34KE60_PRYPA|mmetsp:Transcript_34672/g.86216  ORF Transcript_34672/g.86216 Transcript_34672/m.86216 type:complete len:149 (-) Transcript_34672:175-621(-)